MKLASLFDGSGGFPLAASICGITPIWASEIEPFPIRVTTKRLPQVKHYGDVSKINGADVEPVDIITFGSPCQDLSVAGKRAGMKHDELGDEDASRSGLFFEAIRIIKEMRKATNGRYPTYAIWENVPGAFSSNKRRDFREVLQAFCSVIDKSAYVPLPEKWDNAGTIVGQGYSISWRVGDAQHFGVPQRRRRIYLVADFASECSHKILFERKCVQRDFAQGWFFGQTACFSIGTPKCLSIENHAMDGRCRVDESGKVQTLSSRMGTGGMNVPLVAFEQRAYDKYTDTGLSSTLKAHGGSYGGGSESLVIKSYQKVTGTLSSGAHPGGFNGQDALNDLLIIGGYNTVRRLTPTECARLQGFPDWWCDDLGTENPTEEDLVFWRDVFETHRRIMGTSEKPKSKKQIINWLKAPHADSAEYKMWGNGVALPCVNFVLAGIVLAEKIKG